MLLVGVIHYDLNGSKRWEKLLRKKTPESVSLEWCLKNGAVEPSYSELVGEVQFAGDIIRRYEIGINSSNLPSNVKRYLNAIADSKFFELMTAVRLQKELRYKIFCVDDPRIRDDALLMSSNPEGIERSFTPNVLKSMERMTTEELIRRHQENLDRAYSGTSTLVHVFKSSRTYVSEEDKKSFQRILERKDEREGYISENIHKLRPEVHTCGLAHTYKKLPPQLSALGLFPSETLAHRIEDLGLIILKLIDADYNI